MVFLFHAFNFRALWMGVDLFFVLSGYLITGILLRLKERRATGGYWRPFYFRRILRILPPYLGFLLVLSISIKVPWGQIWYWYAFFGANLPTGLRIAIPAMIPLWSLALEEQFYFVWPGVVLLCSIGTLRKIACLVILVVPILRALCTPLFSNPEPIYNFTPFRVDLLACGAFIAIAEIEDAGWILRKRRLAWYGLIGAGTLLPVLSLLKGFRAGANTVFFNSLGYSLVVVLMGSLLVVALNLRKGIAHRILASGPLTYMGVISYTFYLYGVLVLQKIGEHIHSRAVVALVAFILTGTLAAFSWSFLESPILRLGRKTATLRKLSPTINENQNASSDHQPFPAAGIVVTASTSHGTDSLPSQIGVDPEFETTSS